MVPSRRRNHGARICDRYSYDDLRVLVMENERLRISVLVDQGSDIFEFLYKPLDLDFMFCSPQGIRSPGKYVASVTTERQFPDFYEGGWQELFPLAGVGTEYMGAAIGFHGEVWGLPWQCQIVEDTPECVSAKLWVRTVRVPFLIEKTLTLCAGEPALHIDETVTNEGTTEVEFMWGHHPAFGDTFVDESCRIDTPARQVLIDGETYPWPLADGVDRSLVRHEDRDEQRRMYLGEFDEGWYAVTNTERRVTFAMRWDPEVFAHATIWQEFHYGQEWPWYGRCYALAVEPLSSVPGAFDHGGRLLALGPGRKLSTSLLAAVHEGLTRVTQVRPDGACEGTV